MTLEDLQIFVSTHWNNPEKIDLKMFEIKEMKDVPKFPNLEDDFRFDDCKSDRRKWLKYMVYLLIQKASECKICDFLRSYIRKYRKYTSIEDSELFSPMLIYCIDLFDDDELYEHTLKKLFIYAARLGREIVQVLFDYNQKYMDRKKFNRFFWKNRELFKPHINYFNDRDFIRKKYNRKFAALQ